MEVLLPYVWLVLLFLCAVIGAQAGGTDLVMVTGHVNQAMLRVMTMPGINSIEELEETAKLYLLLRGAKTRYLTPAQVKELMQ